MGEKKGIMLTSILIDGMDFLLYYFGRVTRAPIDGPIKPGLGSLSGCIHIVLH
ncbi:MAG: hypothetical protein ACFFE6_11180 [Candidatus Thorarchaeota archaeon]